MRKTEVSTDSVSEFELGETEADEWQKIGAKTLTF